MEVVTKAMLLDYKRTVTRILNESAGPVGFLPRLHFGLCNLLGNYPRGCEEVQNFSHDNRLGNGALSYMISAWLLTPDDYSDHGMGSDGQWTDKRYEYLWLIDLLTDEEWLELFPSVKS